MRITFTTSKEVADVLATLGRTEDIRFSPQKRRLAVAAFYGNKIAVFDISKETFRSSQAIHISQVVECFSAHLAYPHGIDFIDEETIVVANRSGRPTVFKLPSANGVAKYELEPIGVFDGDLIRVPGSVAVTARSGDLYELLICNNAGHTITKHRATLGREKQSSGCVLLRKWLDIPDGISISSQGRIAISNHNRHSVFVYENGRILDESSDPDGILRGPLYPHGVRFTSDDRFVLVTDSGAPYLYVYVNEGNWAGVHLPRLSLKVLSETDFLRVHVNPQDGGPKGLDIDEAAGILAITCEAQPLAFYDLKAILKKAATSPERITQGNEPSSSPHNFVHLAPLLVKHELELEDTSDRQKLAAEKRSVRAVKRMKRRIRQMQQSTSWRLTAPMRWILATIRSTAMPKR
jgi:hypothetical protein